MKHGLEKVMKEFKETLKKEISNLEDYQQNEISLPLDPKSKIMYEIYAYDKKGNQIKISALSEDHSVYLARLKNDIKELCAMVHKTNIKRLTRNMSDLVAQEDVSSQNHWCGLIADGLHSFDPTSILSDFITETETLDNLLELVYAVSYELGILYNDEDTVGYLGLDVNTETNRLEIIFSNRLKLSQIYKLYFNEETNDLEFEICEAISPVRKATMSLRTLQLLSDDTSRKIVLGAAEDLITKVGLHCE